MFDVDFFMFVIFTVPENLNCNGRVGEICLFGGKNCANRIWRSGSFIKAMLMRKEMLYAGAAILRRQNVKKIRETNLIKTERELGPAVVLLPEKLNLINECQPEYSGQACYRLENNIASFSRDLKTVSDLKCVRNCVRNIKKVSRFYLPANA